MRLFFAHAFIVLAAWSVVIKYVFSVAWALAEGAPIATYIYWDAWPVAHLWLAWALITRTGYAAWLAIGMAAVEIAIVVTKFALFLPAPEWTIWSTNWFINKVFVLALFTALLPWAVIKRRALAGPAGAAETMAVARNAG